MSHHETDSSRRGFLKGSAASVGGLVLGFYFPTSGLLGRVLGGPDAAMAAEGTSAAASSTVNSWLKIGSDGVITIFMAKAEMGQGVYTTLPSLIAEELEADWQKVRVEFAPSLPEFAKFGPFTGGSSSTRGGYDALRRVGAAAREMLIAAGAKKWNVPPGECVADQGFVVHAKSKRKAAYALLAADAATLPVPQSPKLKDPKNLRLIGKSLRRLDAPAKTDGSAVFAIDVKLPDMLIAAVKTSPIFGGEVENLDELKKAAPEGTRVEKIPNGVAVLSKNYWTSQKTLDALPVKFKAGPGAGVDTTKISALLREAASGPQAKIASSAGDASQKFPDTAKKVSAEYEVPYLAHATMEPMTCVAHVRGAVGDISHLECEIWAGTQSPFFNKIAISKATQIPEANIKINTTFLGGGFGRRAEQDFIVQAATLSMTTQKPVKVVWSREEDTQHDFYRPAFYARFEAVMADDGKPLSWKAVNSGSSIAKRWFPDRMGDSGLDFTAIEGFKDIPYAVPHQEIRSAIADAPVPVGFWRSVGSSQNAFFVESFIDELAASVNADPFEYRRALLKGKPRHLKVLETAASKAGWTNRKKLAKNHGYGIAIAESFGTIVAQVIEVSVDKAAVRVHRVVCAYDCGPIVNPDNIEAQMQSAIVYGLTAALRGEITIKDGRVEQGNFDTYKMLYLNETPKIEVFRVESNAEMGGIGEPGTPPVAPAVANAVFAVTGQRIRRLPIEKALGEMVPAGSVKGKA